MPLTEDMIRKAILVAHSKDAGFVELVGMAELNKATAFRGASMRGTDLQGQDLSGFDFTDADFDRADVQGADFTRAIGLTPEMFRNARIDKMTKWPPELQIEAQGDRRSRGRPRVQSPQTDMDLRQKVSLALEVLDDEGYAFPAGEFSARGRTLSFVVLLINELRRRRRNPSRMYGSNLVTYLAKPEVAPLRFLEELTSALGLTELGFDASVWHAPGDVLASNIRVAIGTPVLRQVLAHPQSDSLFHMQAFTPRGHGFSYVTERQVRTHKMPEIVASVGGTLETQSAMPFSGYLRVLAHEDGQYIGLNRYLQIPNGAMSLGLYIFGGLQLDHRRTRSLVFAFACTEPCFDEWPIDHVKSARLTEHRFLQLVSGFFHGRFMGRSVCVKSIATVTDR
ncbi:pentapeptide repeat-containing protein [Acidisphaera sp. S103]|uniref:pentapeptide repeat-containing protein n=1 Tax=Acidisphaera sp. S103 TaxID=1747223 RepID=UPI00131DA82E|nr:pentapeptide repeat-containing protein [Acidisphaera sp. S103]